MDNQLKCESPTLSYIPKCLFFAFWKRGDRISLAVFHQGWFVPPASSGWRPGMQLNALQCSQHSTYNRITQPRIPTSLRSRSPASDLGAHQQHFWGCEWTLDLYRMPSIPTSSTDSSVKRLIGFPDRQLLLPFLCNNRSHLWQLFICLLSSICQVLQTQRTRRISVDRKRVMMKDWLVWLWRLRSPMVSACKLETQQS